MKTRISRLIFAVSTAGLAACSGGTSGITTGSLFGASGDKTAAAAAPVVETPGVRAAQVAAVSARAAKCGYNYDPARLKSGFLAKEAQQGAPDMPKLEREYDTIRAKVASTIAADPDFCTDARTRSIKADLGRHTAGDYSAPESAKAIDERLLASAPRTREVINPDFMTDRDARKTKRVEE